MLKFLHFASEEAFPYATDPQNKSNGSGIKTTKKDYLLIISKIPTNRQKEKKKKDRSQQIYVHIHIKKRAVSGVGEGVSGKEKEKDLGN